MTVRKLPNLLVCVCVHTLGCSVMSNSFNSSPPGSSVHGILQARTLEWAAIFVSRGSSQPRDRIQISSTKRTLYHLSTQEAHLTFFSQFSSVAQSCPTLCNPMNRQHARPPCPSPTPRVYPNACPLSQGCHPTISSSVIPFSSCLQSFPTSGSFQMSQLFTSGSQNIGVSASTLVLPMNTHD